MPDHLAVLRERAAYLRGRIEAKKVVGWDVTWDIRERNALLWALARLEAPSAT